MRACFFCSTQKDQRKKGKVYLKKGFDYYKVSG